LGGVLNAIYHVTPRFRKLIKGVSFDDDDADSTERRAAGNEYGGSGQHSVSFTLRCAY
jgi:hypothetical protein